MNIGGRALCLGVLFKHRKEWEQKNCGNIYFNLFANKESNGIE